MPITGYSDPIRTLRMVGVAGFEPAASWSRTKRDTKLRHTPLKRKGNYTGKQMECQAKLTMGPVVLGIAGLTLI